MTDPIADFLTRIRNAVKANHKVVEAPGSKIKREITKILYEQGYILAYKFGTDEKGHPTIKIALKWDAATKTNAIKNLKRVSRPGLRQYASVDTMPRVLNGLGIAILSTSKGIMTDAKARKENYVAWGLVNVAQYLTTYILLASLSICHNTLRC